MLCLGMHSNVMHRFMVQAFQDPSLWSSTGMKCLFSATNAIQSSTTVTTTIWGGLWPAPRAKNPRRRASKTMVSLKGPSGQIRSAQEWYRWKYPGQDMSRFKGTVRPRGSQRDVVYLGWPMAPSYMSPNAGAGGGGVAGSQPMSKAVHMEPK